MCRALKRILARYRAAAVAADYQRGYEWAAVELLKSGGCDENSIDLATYGISDPFDRGARAALFDWHRMKEKFQGGV